jgi:hypothetical protein
VDRRSRLLIRFRGKLQVHRRAQSIGRGGVLGESEKQASGEFVSGVAGPNAPSTSVRRKALTSDCEVRAGHCEKGDAGGNGV